MRRAAIRIAFPATRLVVVGLAGCVAFSLATPASSQAAVKRAGNKTTIVVSAARPKGRVPVQQLGVNHRFLGDGSGAWDAAADQPNPVAVQRLRTAGVSNIRYPGGIVGNLFDWKQSVGDNRGCQTNARLRPQGFKAAQGTSYGLDEHMELANAVGAEAIMMVPFVTGTPSDAADWVEYMNSPADGVGGSNPNGGTDWAEERAQNGHPAPYGVRWWEIGNEQRVVAERFWMSPNRRRALHQYANGDTVRIQDEMLGRDCSHPVTGSVSNGRPNQAFQMLYKPVKPGSVTVEVLGAASGVTWHQVATLDQSNGTDPAYVVNEDNGTVRFGDGNNGAILPKGAQVRVSYTTVHAGVFAFMKAMRKVDPRIKACATWDRKGFIRLARKRKYNCLSVHAYTHFFGRKSPNGITALDGYDQSMLGATREASFVREIKRALPRRVSLAVTEFGTIAGDKQDHPELAASMTRAAYMASNWVSWLDMAIPFAVGGNLVGARSGGVLGKPPDFIMSAEALTRSAIRPLFAAGNRRLRTRVLDNPVRNPTVPIGGTYRGLSVAATKTRSGDLRILVVNRLPGDRIRSKVSLRGFNSRRVADVKVVNGRTFTAFNTSTAKRVRIRTDRRHIGRDGFTQVFQPHSVTVIEVPSRR